MKSLPRFVITFALPMTVAVACRDGGAPESPTPPAPSVEFPRVGQRAIAGQVSAMVDGQPWADAGLVAITADTQDRFVINAVSQTSEQLILVIRPVTGTQVLTEPQTIGQLNGGVLGFWSTAFGGGGSVVIDTAVRGRVTGRFEFSAFAREGTMPPTKTVLNGRFTATFAQ